MHEFETFWNDSRAREFAWHDLNNDGVITPPECLEAVARGPVQIAESEPETREPEQVAASGPESPPDAREEQPSSGGGLWWMQ